MLVQLNIQIKVEASRIVQKYYIIYSFRVGVSYLCCVSRSRAARSQVDESWRYRVDSKRILIDHKLLIVFCVLSLIGCFVYWWMDYHYHPAPDIQTSSFHPSSPFHPWSTVWCYAVYRFHIYYIIQPHRFACFLFLRRTFRHCVEIRMREKVLL